mmetsp:Transcript_34022/g.54535  ORF Transcript_34022/g.54535 Transcript_34022/m.54535 type:complete len:212 (-) Transcript_34022:1589-2224(-)
MCIEINRDRDKDTNHRQQQHSLTHIHSVLLQFGDFQLQSVLCLVELVLQRLGHFPGFIERVIKLLIHTAIFEEVLGIDVEDALHGVLVHVLEGRVEIRDIEGFLVSEIRDESNRRLLGVALVAELLVAAIKDPLNDSQVLAESWPQESALILAEPVHHEHLWQFIRRLLVLSKRQPVSKVVAHIVAAKRTHAKRIQSEHATQSSRSRRGFR